MNVYKEPKYLRDNISQILVKAASLMELGWTTKAFARGKKEERVVPQNPEACKFCAIGSIQRAMSDLRLNHLDYVIYDFIHSLPTETYLPLKVTSIYQFNDIQGSPEPVIRLYRELASHIEQGRRYEG